MRFIEAHRQRVRERVADLARRKSDLTKKVQELQRKMQSIETFPGTKEEFEAFKGEQYDYVDIPGPDKLVWGRSVSRKVDFNLSYLSIDDHGSIFANASELGADAIVRFSANIGWGGAFPEGIPVKKHQEHENSQTKNPR